MLGATTEDTLAAPPWNLGEIPTSQKALTALLTNITRNASITEMIVGEYKAAYPAPSSMWLQISSDVCSVCPTKWLADDMALSSHGAIFLSKRLSFLLKTICNARWGPDTLSLSVCGAKHEWVSQSRCRGLRDIWAPNTQLPVLGAALGDHSGILGLVREGGRADEFDGVGDGGAELGGLPRSGGR